MSTAFPTLFNLATHKDAKVVDIWDVSRVDGGWAPVFLRSFNDWGMEKVERFLRLLHNRNIRLGQEDNLLMKDSKKAGYSVILMYSLLDHSLPFGFPFSVFLESYRSSQARLFRLGPGVRYSCLTN